MIRTVLVQGGKHLLPELGEELGGYAENKLSEARSSRDEWRPRHEL